MSPLWAAKSSARTCSLMSDPDPDHEIGGGGAVDFTIGLQHNTLCLSGEHRWYVPTSAITSACDPLHPQGALDAPT